MSRLGEGPYLKPFLSCSWVTNVMRDVLLHYFEVGSEGVGVTKASFGPTDSWPLLLPLLGNGKGHRLWKPGIQGKMEVAKEI